MAFPTIPAGGFRTASATSNSTTYTVSGSFSGGPGSVGDLIIAFISADGNPTLTTSSSGWSKLGQASNGTVVTGAVFYCYATAADNTFPALTINSTASEQYAAAVHRFKGSSANSLQIEGTFSNGSSTNSDPAALTPSAGSQDYYWVVSRHGDSNVNATAGPSGYSGWGGTSNGGTGGATIDTAYRTATASSENPGVFTSASEQWVCATVAVWNAAPVTHATTGTLTGQIGSVAGSAVHNVPHAASGTLTGQIGGVAGSASRSAGVVTHDTSGALTGQGSTLSGSATRFRAFATSGTLTGQGSSVTGSANRFRAFATSGVLAGQGAAVSGTATRFRAFSTSGTLTGQGASLSGTAAHLALHTTSGVLTGQGAILSGSATRTREHATSGVLAGPGATVSGAAGRNSGAVSHDTSGALTGQIGSIAGSASRLRAFATSGTLTGQGSEVSASALRSGAATVHDASGELTGQGAQIVALSTRQGSGLHGRRRGKRVRFEDELPQPVKVEAPQVEPLPSLDVARAAIADARRAVEAVRIARRQAKERAERQEAINALSVEYERALTLFRQARDAEAQIIRRLRDEDELFFLAA